MKTGPFKFSAASLAMLKTLHPDLQSVLKEAIKTIDFTIVEGHRTPERQLKLYASGRTTPGPILTKVKVSQHNSFPSKAVDIAPYPIDWKASDRFIFLAGHILGIAYMLNIDLRWGGDFNEDNNLNNDSFDDTPHFEIEGV